MKVNVWQSIERTVDASIDSAQLKTCIWA